MGRALPDAGRRRPEPVPGGPLLAPARLPAPRRGDPGGRAAGSDPSYLVEHHVEPNAISSLVLLSLQAGALAAWTNADEAAALATAFNDFFVHEWLPADERMNLCPVVSPHDPTGAAAEIARVADVPRVVGVFLPLVDRLMGNRYYHPIYDAAQEAGLP
jgi:predicted TIM-barrel fold metal-dependent hydrolase